LTKTKRYSFNSFIYKHR